MKPPKSSLITYVSSKPKSDLFFEELFSFQIRMANLCITQQIPVKFLTAPVTKGHILPIKAHQASGTDRIGGAVPVSNYFRDRHRSPVGDCIQK